MNGCEIVTDEAKKAGITLQPNHAFWILWEHTGWPSGRKLLEYHWHHSRNRPARFGHRVSLGVGHQG